MRSPRKPSEEFPGASLSAAPAVASAARLNTSRSLQHCFHIPSRQSCSPSACSRLPASCPSFFPDAALYDCKKQQPACLGNQPQSVRASMTDFDPNLNYRLCAQKIKEICIFQIINKMTMNKEGMGYDLGTSEFLPLSLFCNAPKNT